MNIKEINDGSPNWSAVVAMGLPLAVVTVALPLGFGYGYRRGGEFAARNPRLLFHLRWSIPFLVALGIVAISISLVSLFK